MTNTEEITTTEVAEILGVSPRTVTRYVENGKLTPIRRVPGGRGVLLYNRRDVDRLNPDRWAIRVLRETADELEEDDYVKVPDMLRGKADQMEEALR
jgi:excisionase family DNA binding protein